MYPGAHSRKDSKPRFPTNRAAVLLLSMILLIGIAVGTTVAFLVARTEPIKNTFEYAKVSCEVTGSKESVQINNTGNTAAYIRATYVVTWRDADGKVAVSVPGGYSYTLTENLSNNWKKGTDGYFYYTSPVAPGNSTLDSLPTCNVTYPDNPEYTLSVEILAEAIQSEPAEAVQQAWGATLVGGQLIPPALGN